MGHNSLYERACSIFGSITHDAPKRGYLAGYRRSDNGADNGGNIEVEPLAFGENGVYISCILFYGFTYVCKIYPVWLDWGKGHNGTGRRNIVPVVGFFYFVPIFLSFQK